MRLESQGHFEPQQVPLPDMPAIFGSHLSFTSMCVIPACLVQPFNSQAVLQESVGQAAKSCGQPDFDVFAAMAMQKASDFAAFWIRADSELSSVSVTLQAQNSKTINGIRYFIGPRYFSA